jgi:transcriptional regulator with XRE-family HTH domain
MPRNLELREFLRARRAALQPAEVGLTANGFRRVPGLRREELAALAGVSMDYYVRLEQGRDVMPSDSVLDAISATLRLTPVQRSHLYTLVRGVRDPNDAPGSQLVRPNALRLIEYLDTPAAIIGRGTGVLAGNALFNGLLTDFMRRPPEKRFYAHWLFLDPAAATLLVDWEWFARHVVGVLRAAAVRFPREPGLVELIRELTLNSEAFCELWAEQDVRTHSSGRKDYRHPIAGELTVFHEATQLEEDQWMYLYWVERRSPSERAMDRLRAWVAEKEPQTPDQP